MEQIFEKAIEKATLLQCAASLGHICTDHCVAISNENDDYFYKDIGYAFWKITNDKDLARTFGNVLKEFIHAKDAEKILVDLAKDNQRTILEAGI